MSETLSAGQENSVVVVKREGNVAIVTMNRPERLNAINKDLAHGLHDAFEQIATDSNVRVVVLTGAGRAFCAGGDLSVLNKGRAENDTSELEPMLRFGMKLILQMRTMPQPIIASVNGPAAGAGMNIALAADIRIASEDASFGQNFAKIGLFPDYGGTVLLPEVVAPGLAAEMFFTGEMIDARKALQLGIVNRVTPAADLEKEARALAQKIAQGPPIAIRAVKQTLFGEGSAHLADMLEHELQEQLKCFSSEDAQEGLRAFLEKRAPKFQGK